MATSMAEQGMEAAMALMRKKQDEQRSRRSVGESPPSTPRHARRRSPSWPCADRQVVSSGEREPETQPFDLTEETSRTQKVAVEETQAEPQETPLPLQTHGGTGGTGGSEDAGRGDAKRTCVFSRSSGASHWESPGDPETQVRIAMPKKVETQVRIPMPKKVAEPLPTRSPSRRLSSRSTKS